MSYDPRLIDPDEPIYQTPDEVVGSLGNAEVRRRTQYFPPEEIQNFRRDEYNRQLQQLRQNDYESFLEHTKKELARDLKDILAQGAYEFALDTAFFLLSRGRVVGGRLGKMLPNGGVPPTSAYPQIIRSPCEICLLVTQDYNSAYIESLSTANQQIELQQTLFCWRSNKPECQLPPQESEPPNEEIPEEVEEDIPVPQPKPANYNKLLYCPITITQRLVDTDHIPTIVSRDPLVVTWETVERVYETTATFNYAYIEEGGGFYTRKSFGNTSGVSGVWVNDLKGNINYIRYWDFPSKTFTYYGAVNSRYWYANIDLDEFPVAYPYTTSVFTTEVDIGDKCTFNPLPPIRREVEQPNKPMNKCNCSKIEADLKAIKKILGVNKFPIKAPRRLIQPRNKGEVKLKNYVEVAEFNVRQIDRAVGNLPFSIDFEDKEKKKITVQVESIADALQQLLQFSKEVNPVEQREQNKQIADLNVRELYTLALLQKMIVEMHYELNQVQEFLGYKQEDKTLEAPFAINPLGIALDKLEGKTPEEIAKIQEEVFKTTKVKIRVKENVDPTNLQVKLAEILRHANIASAANSIRVGSRSSLRDFLDNTEWGMNFYQVMLLQQIREAIGVKSKKQFVQWLDEVEKRYTQNLSPVAGDNAEPFQQPVGAQFDLDLTELDKKRLSKDG